jgi:pimeloyl-ACP methyl ester carboxylesterase
VTAPPAPTAETVRHNRVDLALHHLRPGAPDAHALLLLHGLGEETPGAVPAHVTWPGDVLGLDFTGHGRSTVPPGGGYTSEILVGDVDAVLEHLARPVTLLGRGLGAYIALLTAAARPHDVRGAVLADGPGLAGGGIHPGSAAVVQPAGAGRCTPDPYALLELARDVRPADYAQTFVRFAVESSALEQPLFVATTVRPAWVEAVLAEPGVGTGTVGAGLTLYAAPYAPPA